jgi:hypothetical protein
VTALRGRALGGDEGGALMSEITPLTMIHPSPCHVRTYDKMAVWEPDAGLSLDPEFASAFIVNFLA